jgi:hypothetical protein
LPCCKLCIVLLFQAYRLWPAVVSLFLLLLLVSLVFSILKALGCSGLVDQVNQIENGSTPTVQAGWQAAKRYG